MNRLLGAMGLALLALFAFLVPSSAASALVAVPDVTASPSSSPTPSPSPSSSPEPRPVILPSSLPTAVPSPTRPPVPQPVPSPAPLPEPAKTIIQEKPVPGPTRTVFITRVIRETRVVTRQEPPVRVIVAASPRVIFKEVAGPTRIVYSQPEDRVVSVPKALAYSAGALIAGFLIGLTALFLAYGVGFKNSELSEFKEWRKLRNDLLTDN